MKFDTFAWMSLTIHTSNLVKRYKNRTVVNQVSVNVQQGEIVGLLGPNGAGKTTSFYMVVGLIKPDEGEVFLDNQNITKLPMYKRAQMGIGYLPQEASVFRKLSVEDNISAVLEMTKLSKKQRTIRFCEGIYLRLRCLYGIPNSLSLPPVPSHLHGLSRKKHNKNF
jgi:lipopolysaccharide export system ATP-binding protein